MIPPLRERPGEIAPLAHAFMAAAGAQLERRPQLGRDALDLLEGYSWPGNIRELRNVIERAVLLSGGGAIRPEHLPMDKMRGVYMAGGPARAGAPGAAAARVGGGVRAELATRSTPGDAERDRIIATLERCRGNQTKAAQLLGMSWRTLSYRLERYGVRHRHSHLDDVCLQHTGDERSRRC